MVSPTIIELLTKAQVKTERRIKELKLLAVKITDIGLSQDINNVINVELSLLSYFINEIAHQQALLPTLSNVSTKPSTIDDLMHADTATSQWTNLTLTSTSDNEKSVQQQVKDLDQDVSIKGDP